MGMILRIRPIDDGGGTVELEPADDARPLQDEDGFVDFDKSWPSLRVILQALDVGEADRFVDEDVDAADVEQLAGAVEPYGWDDLFAESIVEADDLPDDVDYVSPYYEQLRQLAMTCAEVEVGWEGSLG